MPRLSVAILVVSTLAAAPPAAGSCGAALVTELGTVFPVTDTRVSSVVRTDVKRHPAVAGALRYMRLQLKRTGSAPADWRVHLREPSTGRLLQRLGPEDLREDATFWSDRLALSEVLITFAPISKAETPDVVVSVMSYFAMPVAGEFHFYSAVDSNNPGWGDLHSAARPDRWQRLGDSIGIIVLRGAGKASTCTGTAVGDGLFLTNWHCGAVSVGGALIPGAFWDQAVCEEALIDFSWDDDAISDDFRCVGVLAQDSTLDYALLAIESVSGASTVGPVAIFPAPLALHDSITLIHHPQALSKKISLGCTMVSDTPRTSWIGNLQDTEFFHRCDTEGGSSGAPVFDREGRLRALHHLGYDRNPVTCAPAEGEGGSHNKAVWISKIVDDLANKGFVLSGEGYIDIAAE